MDTIYTNAPDVIEEKKKSKYQNIYNGLLMVALWLFIALLLFTLVTIVKYKDLISQDPINYGMGLHNFTDCSCQDIKGQTWYSQPGGGFIRYSYAPPSNYDILQININKTK